MTKKQTELSEELREAVFEAARAGAAEAYTQNTGYVNYFKAMETLLYNYKKLAALVADEEAYCEVEYHAGRKTFSTTPQAKGFIQRKTEAEIVEEMREEKQKHCAGWSLYDKHVRPIEKTIKSVVREASRKERILCSST